MLDRTKMVAAIAARLKVRLDEDDPAFVLVELNRLALEEAAASLVDQLAPLGDRLEGAARLAAEQLITSAVQQIVTSGQMEREKIGAAGDAAKRSALSALERFMATYETANRARWTAIGAAFAAVVAVGAFSAGYVVGEQRTSAAAPITSPKGRP